MATLWERMARRRAARRYDRLNPIQGSAPLGGAMDASREATERRAALESQRYASDRQGVANALAGFNDLAAGRGPSLAQEMLKGATDRNVAQTIAAMGSARGGNLSMAGTNAAAAGTAAQQQGSQQLAELRAQEQLAAMSSGAGLAAQQAGLSSGRELGLLGMGNDALLGQAGLASQWQIEQARLQHEARQRRNQAVLGGLQLGAQVGGDVLGGVLSDERLKTDVEPVKPGGLAATLARFDDVGEASAVLAEVKPVEFRYTRKGRKAGGVAGRLAGVMAQAVEAAGPKGREAVTDGEDGAKRIDGARGLSLALAAGADHERRLRALEGGA
jgi:hypothetical protein